MEKYFKKYLAYVMVVVFSLTIFFSGFFAGKFNEVGLSGVHADNKATVASSEEIDLSPFWRVWDILNLKYMPASEERVITDQDKIYGAIKGMVDSFGDPYTQFLTPEENKEFEDSIQGEFFGVGMEIDSKDKFIIIVSPLKNTPAERAGLLAGDVILTIDGVSTLSMSVNEAVSKIRGPAGTVVKLMIFREGEDETFEVSVIRDKINVPNLETSMEDDVFIISLYNFNSNSTTQFRNAIREFSSSGKNKLILDLRGNPGGFLDASVDIASWFLPSGTVVVKEDFGSSEKVFRSRGYNTLASDFKMVVLVDKGSASASEIVAGALQAYEVATIIGTNTFGKGSVQELVSVTKETSLKVTVAQWLIPEGKSISDGGLTPDIVIDEAPEGIKLKDFQMQKALEFLKN